MTVTAPLDTGTGQQRYVVAYTLKQGIEKQPDILSAQKSMLKINLLLSKVLTLLSPLSQFFSFIQTQTMYSHSRIQMN